MHNALRELGFTDDLHRALEELVNLDDEQHIGRVRRIDRGWSTYLCVRLGEIAELVNLHERKVRNIGADVAVGDWIVTSADGERIIRVLPRRSRLVRRASSDEVKADAQTIAANIDVVFLVHALDVATNQRRLERELVLAFDSGAQPVVVLTKSDRIEADEVERAKSAIEAVSLGVSVHVVSSMSGEGLGVVAEYVKNGRTAVVLGASGAGKSTLINALTGRGSQQTGATRAGDNKGRHTTTAVDLVELPNHGWLIDTPGVRAVGLWTSGRGIERAFSDVFALADGCRFRDCKHETEPACAVRRAIAEGKLTPERLESMRRLVAEEQLLEHQQRRTQKRS